MDSDTESLDYPEIAEVSEDDLEPETEQIEGSEVFFGETGEIGDLSQVPEVETEEILPEEPASLKKQDVVPELSKAEVEPEATTPVEPPKELANVLAQESDGQISLVMPEAESIEKQITGQINIEDILAEWERKKKENLEKREEEVRQHVLQQTGAMFTEFEQAVRDGLLEKLEKEKAVDADTVTDTDEVEELEEIADVNDETEKAPAEVSEEEPEPEPADTDIVDTEEVEELEEEPAVAEYEEESATEEPDAVVDMEVTQEPAAEIPEVPEETTAEIEEASEEKQIVENAPRNSTELTSHEIGVLLLREKYILDKIKEYQALPPDQMITSSVMDMRVPGGRGKRKRDGANQQIGMYQKETPAQRILQLQEALNKIHGRILSGPDPAGSAPDGQ